MKLVEFIRNKRATIVDVRTANEFRSGSVAGAVNIPLPEIPQRLRELQELPGPLVLCCASGNRSAQAQRFLSRAGIPCINGGSWLEVREQAQSA